MHEHRHLWIWQLLGELDFPMDNSTSILCDHNQSEIQVVYKPIADTKMNHVELHVHYLSWFKIMLITSLLWD